MDDGLPFDKPCLALMGEFSAGKSTLANLLIGYDPLPVQVVATQLPPVRISYGKGDPYRVDLQGQQFPVDLRNLDRGALSDTAYLQIFSEEDILQQCDLLDMPGISDPNMPPEVWERMIAEADGVLWCSPATQAWRQSEAAVWASLPEALREHSLLLLTRIDKLTTPSDRERVLARVKAETAGLFADVLPISLVLATQEQDDYDLWVQSGAEAFAGRLIQLLSGLNSQMTGRTSQERLRLPGFEAPEGLLPERASASTTGPSVVPRRVASSGNRTARPA